MKAAVYARRGAARDVLALADVPMPAPGAGEVRVRLHASGVNPSDWKSRSGLTTTLPPAVPVIPHSDGAGVIDAVGSAVDPRRIGERVWVWNAQWQRPHGTAAQFIALPAAQAVPLPHAVGFAEGACLGIPAMTATQALRLGGVAAGQVVLIHGGAGAVSHYAIQFASRLGARVLTTVSGAAKAAHARDAGAHECIDYRTENVGARVRALSDGRGADVVIDLNFSANAPLLPEVVRPHGRVVYYGTSEPNASIPALWLMRSSVDLRAFLVYELSAADRAAAIAAIQDGLTRGWLRHAVARELPLREIVQAHELVERGEVIGNVVLTID